MEFIIIYFSGTGNTELIAKELKKRLETGNNTVELLSVENPDQIKGADFKNKIIGYGYPIYKFTYPDNLKAILPALNSAGADNKYFQFCTYARFTADAFYDFSRRLDKNKYRLIAERSFKAPSNGISARMPEDDYEYKSVMFFEDDIAAKIDSFAADILENIDGKNKVRQKKPGPLAFLRNRIVKNIEITKYPELWINRELCTLCGLCARKCPDHNLVKKEDHIEIIDDINCLHCLRCMHHCPANAVSFGKLTRQENRYTIKLRDAFYEKSKSGHKEKYWAEFSAVCRKWKKNTVKYWLRHRRNPEK